MVHTHSRQDPRYFIIHHRKDLSSAHTTDRIPDTYTPQIGDQVYTHQRRSQILYIGTQGLEDSMYCTYTSQIGSTVHRYHREDPGYIDTSDGIPCTYFYTTDRNLGTYTAR